MAQPPTQPRFSTPSPPLPPQMHAGWPGSAGIRQVPVFFVPNTVMPYPIYPGNPPPAGAPMFLGTPAGPHSSARTYAVSLTPRGSPSVSSLPLAAASPSVTAMDVEKMKPVPVPVVVPEPESTKTEEDVFRQVVDCLMKSGPCTMSALYHSVPKSAQRAIMECGSVKAFLATSPHFVVDDDSKSVSLAETEETLALLSSMTAAASNSSERQRTTSMDTPVSASLTKHHSAPEAAPSAALESKLPTTSVSSTPVEPKTSVESTVAPTPAPTKISGAASVVSSTAVSTVTSTASRVVITNPVSGEPVVLTRATKSVIITDAAGRPVELPNKVKTKMPKAPATAPTMPVSFVPSWPRVKADGGADGSKQVDISDHVAKPLSAGVSNSAKFPWAAKNSPQRAVVPLHETTTEHAKLMSIFKQPSTPPTPLSEEQKSATTTNSSVIEENIFVDRSIAASAGTAAATVKSSELEPFAAEEANSGPLEYGMADAVESGTFAIGDEDVDAVSEASSSTLVGHTQQANTSNSRLRLDAPVFQSRSSVVLKTDSSSSAINPCASEFVPLAASSAALKTSSGVSIGSSSLVNTTYSRPPQRFVINCADDGDDSSSYDSHPDTPRRKELTRKRGSASTAKSKDVRAGGDVHCSMSATACVQCCDACVTMETQNALCDQCSLGLHARASGKRVSEAEHRELEVKAAMLLMLLTTSDADEKQKLLDESSSALTTCQQQVKVANVTSTLPQIPVSLEPYDSLVKDTRRLLSVCRKSSVLVNAGKMASDSRSSSTIATVDDDVTATPRCKNRPHYMRPPKPVDQELSTDDDRESLPPSQVSHDKNKPAASTVDSRGDDVRPSSGSLGMVMDVKADVKSEPSGLLSSQAAMTMMSVPAPAPTPSPSTPDITVQKLLQTMVFAQQQQQQQMLQVQKQQQILAAIQALGGSSAVINDPSLFAIVQKMAADPLPTTVATFPSVSNPLMPSTLRPLANSTSNPLAAVLTANPLLQSAVGSSALANSMANPLAAFSGNSYLQSQISGMDPLQAQNLLGMSNALGASLSNFATLQNLLGTLPQQFGGGMQNPPGISSQAFGAGGLPDVLPLSQAAGVGLQSQVVGVPFAATADVASTGIQQSPSPQSVSLGMSMSLSTVSQAFGARLSNVLSAQTSMSQARDSSVVSLPQPAQAVPSVADINVPVVPQTSVGITPSPAAPLLDEGSKNKLSSSLSSHGNVDDDLVSALHQQTAIRNMTHLMNDLKVDIEGSPSLSSTQLSKPVRSTSANMIAKSDLLLSISRVSVAHSDIRGNRDEAEALNSSDDERRTASIMNDGFLTSLSETLTSVKDGTMDKMLPPDLRRVTAVKENDDEDELEEDFVLTKRDSPARGRRNNEDHWEEEEDFWSMPTDKWMLKETMQKTLNNLATVETTRGSMCSGTIAADNKVKAGDGPAQSQSRFITTGSHQTSSYVEDRRSARAPVSSEISRSVVSTAQSQSYSGAKRRFDDAGPSNASQLNSGSSVKMAATGGPGEQQMLTGSWTLKAHVPENFKFGNLQPPGKSSIRRWDSEETEEPELPQRRPLVNWENVLTSPTKTTMANSSVSGASALLPDNNNNTGEFGGLNAPPTSFLANGRDAGNSCREDASDGGKSEAKPEVKVTKEKSKFARLTDSLHAKHPNKTEKDIHDAMKTVRASRGGTLANVPMSVVLQEASELLSAPTTHAEPTPVAVTTDHQAVCCICADVMLPTHSVDRLDCDHSFHASCIRRWLEQNRTCPVCRNMALLHDEFPSLSAAQSRFK